MLRADNEAYMHTHTQSYIHIAYCIAIAVKLSGFGGSQIDGGVHTV